MSVRGPAFLHRRMVGAGIFASLGEAGTVAGAAVWLSFLIAGVVAAIAATLIVLGFFVVDTARNAPETFVAMVAILLCSRSSLI